MFRIYGPGRKIVDQHLENAPTGGIEMPLGPGGIFWVGGAASQGRWVAGSDRARYWLSQVHSYGAVVAGARSLAVTGKWSEG